MFTKLRQEMFKARVLGRSDNKLCKLYLAIYNTKLYDSISVLVYRFISTPIRNAYFYIHNLVKFNKVLRGYRPFDASFCYDFLVKHFEIMYKREVKYLKSYSESDKKDHKAQYRVCRKYAATYLRLYTLGKYIMEGYPDKLSDIAAQTALNKWTRQKEDGVNIRGKSGGLYLTKISERNDRIDKDHIDTFLKLFKKVQ